MSDDSVSIEELVGRLRGLASAARQTRAKLTVSPDECERLASDLGALGQQIKDFVKDEERALQMLEVSGVPRERAGTIANGIDVLATRYRKEIEAQMVEIADLRSKLLVPGTLECAKCKFHLVRANLYVQSGTIGPGDSKTEPCPNGCGPLWPVTWEQQAKYLAERCGVFQEALLDIAHPNNRGRKRPAHKIAADALGSG